MARVPQCYYDDWIGNTYSEGLVMGTTITAKGQVTIPKHIRDPLNLMPGSMVEFVISENGQIVLVPPKARKTKDRFERARQSNN